MEEHKAWWASLSAEQKMIAHIPVGYKFNLLLIALIKRALKCKMSAGERLQILERLNGMTDGYITPEMLAMIEPAGNTEFEIIKEAQSLDTTADRCEASFAVLTMPDVFEKFLCLNPSLLAAIKLTARPM
jgi:hypothetical protein